MKTYEILRRALTDPETTAKKTELMFTRWALGEDSTTAALVSLAASDVPLERAAQFVGLEYDEVDALIALSQARMSRGLREERERRGLAA